MLQRDLWAFFRPPHWQGAPHRAHSYTQGMSNKRGAEAAPLVDLNRKMPGPAGAHSTLFQQCISPTSLWGRGAKIHRMSDLKVSRCLQHTRGTQEHQ